MTLSDDQVHDWIASLVDRTAAQLRAELDVLVRQAQEAAPPREVVDADADLDAGDNRFERARLRRWPPSGLKSDRPIWRRAARVLDGDGGARLGRIALGHSRCARRPRGRCTPAGSCSSSIEPDALTGWRWHGYTPDPRDASMLGDSAGRSRPGGPSGAIGCD